MYLHHMRGSKMLYCVLINSCNSLLRFRETDGFELYNITFVKSNV